MTVIVVLILLVLALVILAIWNYRIFRSLNSIKESPQSEIKDARYWELNYKMDYLVAVAAMGAAVVVFLGYESFQSAKDAVKSEINNELVTVRDDINKTEITLQNLKLFSDSVKKGVSMSGTQIHDQLSTLNELKRKIETINNKNIVQQEFYVVRSLNLLFDHEKRPGSNRFYFKSLITDSGDRLPEFAQPPLVIPIVQTNTEVSLFNIKRDSFDALWGATLSTDFTDTIKYSIVIIGK